MKKLFAVVLAIAMLFTMSSIAASAETAPTVSFSANKATFGVGEKVELTVNAENAGAVDFTLNYDANTFEYVTATFTNTDVNKKSDSVKAVDGGIRVFLLDSDATLTFKAIGASANAAFTANKVDASNVDGTKKYEITPAPVSVSVTEAGHIEVLGATTRDTANINEQDLGFIGKLYVPEDKTVEKFGILAAFTTALGSNELTLNTDEAIVAKKEVTDAALINTILAGGGEFTSHVKTTGSYALMGKNITARFYIKFTDSDVIYSNNISVVKGSVVAENGVAKKSMVQVLASQISAICNAAGATKEMADEAAQVVAAYNADKNDTTKAALLQYVDKYADEFLLG